MDGDINNNNPHMANSCSSSSSLMMMMNCSTDQVIDGSGCCEIDWAGLLSGSCLSLEMEKKESGSGAAMETHEDYHGGKKISNKGKMVMGSKRSAAMPRVAFQTRSAEDVLDDGYRWRKYGQKAVKHSTHPRSYYRCTHHTCNVKKQIQRHSKDPTIVVTTYEGIHNHPSEKLMETLSPLLKQLQFLSGI